RSLKDELISQLPGAVLKEKERGERDPRLDAALTLQEFRGLMIHWILDHNRARIEGMRLQEFIFKNHLEPRPIDLWEWGTINKSGHLRVMDRDKIRLHLLPSGKATVTAKGIGFIQALYIWGRPVQNEWYVGPGPDG